MEKKDMTGFVKIIYTHPPTVVGVGYQKVVNGEVVDILDEEGNSIKDNPPSTECHCDKNVYDKDRFAACA